MARFRSIPAKLAASLFVAAGVLIAAEIGLRVALGPPPPPVQVYSGLAPVDTYFEQRGGTVYAVFQSIDPMPPFRAEPRGARAAVLGGSSVHQGSGSVTLRQEFPHLIQTATGYEVLNLGNPGLDSHDLVTMAEELLAGWSIDALVVYTGHNDFGNTWFLDRYGDLAGGALARSQAALERLQMYAQLQHALGHQSGVPRVDQVLGEHEMADKPALSTERSWAALRYLEANLRRIAWLCQQEGIPLILVPPVSALEQPPVGDDCEATPCALQVFEEATRLRRRDPEESIRLYSLARDLDPIPLRAPSAAVEAVRRVAAEEPGVILVDPWIELPRGALGLPAGWVFMDPVHFTREGHAAMAEMLAPRVSEALQGAD